MPKPFVRALAVLLVLLVGAQGSIASSMPYTACGDATDPVHAAPGNAPAVMTSADQDLCSCQCSLCSVCHSPALAALRAAGAAREAWCAVAPGADAAPVFTNGPLRRPPRG